MRIMAIDVGVRHRGVAIIETDQGVHVLHTGRWAISDKASFDDVIRSQVESILELLVLYYDPNQEFHVVFESPYAGKNIKTFYYLAQVIGALKAALLTMHTYPIRIYEYPPLKVKEGIAGNGHASKDDVYRALRDVFKLDVPVDSDYDVSDALALAVYEAMGGDEVHAG